MTSIPRITFYGEVLWDRLPGGAVPGGAPLNAALRSRALGAEAELLSRVGRDVEGDSLLAFLREQGLDTGCLQCDPSQPTGAVDVDLADAQAAQYRILTPSAWDFVSAEDYLAIRDGAQVLVYGSLAFRHPASRGSLAQLQATADLRVLDLNLRPPHWEPAILLAQLARADWVKCNGEELAVLAALLGLDQSLETLMHTLCERFDWSVLCVTEGAAGARLLYRGQLYREEAFPVTVADTVGCGDAFLAALLTALLAGAKPAQALRRANALGALVASRSGGTAEVGAEELEALLRSSEAGLTE